MVQVATPEPKCLGIRSRRSRRRRRPPCRLGLGVTVAVKVTLWPTVEGFGEEVSAVVVVVVSASTVWLAVPVLVSSWYRPL